MADMNLSPALCAGVLKRVHDGLPGTVLALLIVAVAGCSQRTEPAAQKGNASTSDQAAPYASDTSHTRADSSIPQPSRRAKDPFEHLAENDPVSKREQARRVNSITRLTGAEEEELEGLQILRGALTTEIAGATDPDTRKRLDAKLAEVSERIVELKALAASRRR